MSMYKQFATDGNLEKKGIVLDFADYRITIARAGGANKKYLRVMEAKTKPYRRLIETETLDPDVAQKVLREVYAATVILNWEVRQGDGDKAKWVKGLEGPDGGVVPFNEANVLQALENLPELFRDIQQQANSFALFRAGLNEADAGN